MSVNSKDPLVSIIIPVYNEQSILFGSVVELVERMKEFGFEYEIIVSENGSTDTTRELAFALERKYEQVRALTSVEPNYGKALRYGILHARGDYVICDEVDILDTEFYKRALDILMYDQVDMVVGSKLHAEAKDPRGPFRHTASIIINSMLRVLLGFKGTDTHGLKAFNRKRIVEVVNQCVVDKDIFASELVIRAEHGNYRIIEVPVEIHEKRKPSINLFRRVPRVLTNMAKLFYHIRVRS